jgi:hypothetical protein
MSIQSEFNVNTKWIQLQYKVNTMSIQSEYKVNTKWIQSQYNVNIIAIQSKYKVWGVHVPGQAGGNAGK